MEEPTSGQQATAVVGAQNSAGTAARFAAEPDLVAIVSDLSVTFPRGGLRIQAVRGVSLDIRRGEILGLVGESGSGKSVLGLSVLGLLPAQADIAGTVCVRGNDMVQGSVALRRNVRKQHLGAVFQDPMTSLNPTMRVGRQVAEAAGSGAEAARLLKAVGIPDAERRMAAFPHELSGGLRQRVMIAMAVAGAPSLVIADEPTTALDVMVQAQVLGLLRNLRDEIGCSFLMITHDLGVAAQVADRIAVMYAGRLAELGPTADVLRTAAHPYSVALTRSRLSLSSVRGKALPTLAGEVPDPAAPPPGCPFEPRCSLRTDECTASVPAPREVATGHASACILPLADVRAAADSAASPAAPESIAPADPQRPGAGENGVVSVQPAALAAEQRAAPSAAGQPAPAAHVQNVARTFRVKAGRRRVRLEALRDVSVTVAEGESVAIVGESGSGKSTLLRVVAGLDRADTGGVALGHAKARPQMVFQDAGASLTPWLTVGAMIGERLRHENLSSARKHERIEEVLTHVGLPAHVKNAKSAQLSGGQRQRVALARATVVPPEVLLCDEPTSALDVSLAAVVLNLIARLRQELGMSVLFVTHDLAVARVVADRIAVMYLGRLVEIGPAEEVVANPQHPYTKALVGAVPELGKPPAALPGEPASPLSRPPGCSFHPRCPVAEPVCADPEFDPHLIAAPGHHDRLVACIHAGKPVPAAPASSAPRRGPAPEPGPAPGSRPLPASARQSALQPGSASAPQAESAPATPTPASEVN
jgi:peptide/nickel transport system ATP-binding protein